MKRREFIKLSLAACVSLALPTFSSAADLDQVNFSQNEFNSNAAQMIMIFMYGGASQLGGNLTNIEEIKDKSQSDYSYFRGLTPTANGCWQEAGGVHMEEMMDNGDMTLFRTCYSHIREAAGNKAHGLCTVQNQKGSFADESAGMVTNLAQILEKNGVIDENSVMPFVTLEGESNFYAQDNLPLSSYLKAVGLDENFENPYKRNVRNWMYYTQAERESAPDTYNNAQTGFDPALDTAMNSLAQQHNTNVKIKSAFTKRSSLSVFIDDISEAVTPDLADNAYPANDRFANKIEASIKILAGNSDTKVITINTGGLGGWDDHNEARDYVTRNESMFKSLKSAMAHLEALGKKETISIMVFSEFGRNVNLNSALGWDHGNLQNLYILGGKNYFTHRGVVGETVVQDRGAINRLYLQPKTGTYEFEPLSIAATMYRAFGIQNPEILTEGNVAVDI